MMTNISLPVRPTLSNTYHQRDPPPQMQSVLFNASLSHLEPVIVVQQDDDAEGAVGAALMSKSIDFSVDPPASPTSNAAHRKLFQPSDSQSIDELNKPEAAPQAGPKHAEACESIDEFSLNQAFPIMNPSVAKLKRNATTGSLKNSSASGSTEVYMYTVCLCVYICIYICIYDIYVLMIARLPISKAACDVSAYVYECIADM